jgi:hypothetical protein
MATNSTNSMNEMKEMLMKMAINNKMYVILFFTFIIIIGLLMYISNKMNLKDKNCSKLKKSSNSIVSISDKTSPHNKYIGYTLNNYFIKTAYNCCCTGNFKNDYVDICALKNCASNGVRALDFQIYSLNNKPIVSASSVESIQYKEIYNYIDFYTAIKSARQYFVDDHTNNNRHDPLFLIFRLYTKSASIYDMMAQALDEVYGHSSPTGNMIYIFPPNTATNNELSNVPLIDLIKKIVIIIDTSFGDPNVFENSKLNRYSTMTTGKSLSNHLYRETKLLSLIHNSTSTNVDVSNNLTILYPNLQQNKKNYDFNTSGIFNYVSFIGMNFQSPDEHLSEYNNIFSESAILYKPKIIQVMCDREEYSSTNICTAVKKQKRI